MTTVHKLGIDLDTFVANRILKRLKVLKTTVNIKNRGAYHQDPEWTNFHIDTTWTEKELDEWLYNLQMGVDFNASAYTRTGKDNEPLP